MNIAIYGGSFDPPHIAHEQIAFKALEHLDISKLIVVPTYLNPFKSDFHLEPNERFDLVQTLFEEHANIEVSKFEINQNKAVASIETVHHFKEYYHANKIYLIMGEDNLVSLHKWHKYEELNQLVEFVIISREGYEAKNDIIHFRNIDMNIDISSTTLRNNIDLKYIPEKLKQKVKHLWKKELKE